MLNLLADENWALECSIGAEISICGARMNAILDATGNSHAYNPRTFIAEQHEALCLESSSHAEFPERRSR